MNFAKFFGLKFLIEHLLTNVSQRFPQTQPNQAVKPIRDCFCEKIVLAQAITEF